jgi:ubiquinone/menaquinone biosynthesis C-methylase UbiE
VFAEIYRVLKPGGVVVMSFSNRLFYEKAIAAWRQNTDYGRQQLVKSYFRAVAGFSEPEVVKQVLFITSSVPTRLMSQ